MRFRSFYRADNFFAVNLTLVCLGLFLSSWTSDAVAIQKRRAGHFNKSTSSKKCGSSCLKRLRPFTSKEYGTTESSILSTLIPQTEESMERIMASTTLSPVSAESSQSVSIETGMTTMSSFIGGSQESMSTSQSRVGSINFDELHKLLRAKRKQCKKLGPKDQKAFTCEKLKLSSWLLQQLERNSTDLFRSYVRLTRNGNMSDITEESELMPENWAERVAFRMIENMGEPVDKLIFFQLKKYAKSRQLSVDIPHLLQLEVSPRTHSEVSTGRTLFDPGFNLKLKLPFFRDELKVAVSTGPSFLAGLGVGIIVLGIKSLFAPFILAIKAFILSMIFKDMSPLDLVKTIAGPLVPSWMAPAEDHHQPWEQSVEHYEPPHVYNAWDNYNPPSPDNKKSAAGYLGSLLSSMGNIGSLKQSQSHSQPNPSFANSHFTGPSRPSSNPHYSSQFSSYPTGDGEGRTQPVRSREVGGEGSGGNSVTGPSGPESQDLEGGFNYASNDDGESFDPFYSPLLSRIDSIFMHLGFTEEGCKERAVCSIYKFPVKYAPYSNLLSAQLSKHQSELKRPVSSSPRILRYFKYMKAAKDGQAALNCIELYPRCTNDTEKLSNLPMVKTFQQLTELMGTGSG